MSRSSHADILRRDYSTWILRALSSLNASVDKAQIGAVELNGVVVQRQDTVSQTIAAAYERGVSPADQTVFREALGDALRSQARLPTLQVKSYRDLIMTVGLLQADEAVDALVGTLGPHTIGAQYPSLFADAISTLRRMNPTRRVVRAIELLMESRQFPDAYLLFGLEALISSKPGTVAAHVKTYLPRIDKLWLDRGEAVEARADDFAEFAAHVHSVVPLSAEVGLMRMLWDIDPVHWLVGVLLRAPRHPAIESDDQGYWLSSNDRRAAIRLGRRGIRQTAIINAIHAAHRVSLKVRVEEMAADSIEPSFDGYVPTGLTSYTEIAA